MRQLKQRYGDWALITGGTSGIGAALANELAQAIERTTDCLLMSAYTLRRIVVGTEGATA